MRTLEEILKFDSGLTIGTHRIDAIAEGKIIRAVVEISNRGIVRMIKKPRPETMYSSWSRIKGNDSSTMDKKSGVIVWGARLPEVMAMFEGNAKEVDLTDWVKSQREMAK